MEKYCITGQATNDNMAHAHCMLDTKGYKHTLEYVRFTVFPLQQWLQKHASTLRYTHIAYPVNPHMGHPDVLVLQTFGFNT